MSDSEVTNSVELLEGGATLPWKVHPGVERIYDKALKSYVYQLPANGSQAVMQLPRDGKDLGIVQPYLVFQLFLPQNYRACLLEVAITDTTSARRWLLLGASTEEAHTTMRFARLPLLGLPQGTWFNLCVDLQSLVDGAFGQVVKSVDGIVIHPECRLRKIFTLRSLPNSVEVLDRQMIKFDPTGQTEDCAGSQHLPDYAGIDQIYVMNANRVPNLERAEAPRPRHRTHPLAPRAGRAERAERAEPEREVEHQEAPKQDLPEISEPKKSSKSTSGCAPSKSKTKEKVPAISTQGVAAGACYGRPLSKQKLENLTAHPKGRTARARDRLPTARKLRPLPLEMRVSIEDSGGRREGASQPSSWGSTSLSSRRGRKTSKGRAEEETSDSVTPSPTEAAKRRQAHTMKTLHKTAEIYGAPDAVGHTLRLPNPNGRLERGDAQVNAGREAQVSPPNPLNFDPVKTTALADIQLKPINDVSKVNAGRDGRDAQVSPPNPPSLDPRVRTAGVADLPKPDWPKVGEKAAHGPVDAWSALSASVRHGDCSSFASLFRGRQLVGGSPPETNSEGCRARRMFSERCEPHPLSGLGCRSIIPTVAIQ